MKWIIPTKKIWILLTAILALFWAGCDEYPGHERVEETVERTFTVAEKGILAMDVSEGSIEVIPQPGTSLVVKAYRSVRTDDPREAKEIFDSRPIRFSQSGSEVRIESEGHGRFFSLFGRSHYQVRFVITLPPSFSVEARTRGGSIQVGDLDGPVRVRTSGGSLQFGTIRGPVTGKTNGGAIVLEGCGADAELNTSGGSITTGTVTGSLRAKTSGGSIRIEGVSSTVDARTSGGSIQASILKQPDGDCILKTNGGSVTLYLFPEVKATIDAKTFGGSVRTDVPITYSGDRERSRLYGKINDGGPVLFLRTSGGGISIRQQSAKEGEAI